MDEYLAHWLPAARVEIPPLAQEGFPSPVLRRAKVEPLPVWQDPEPETITFLPSDRQKREEDGEA